MSCDPRRRPSTVIRLAVLVVLAVLLGFASALASRGASEDRARYLVEATYHEFAPAGPALQWLPRGQLAISPAPDEISMPSPFDSYFRRWLFQPRIIFYAHPRPPFAPGPRSFAFLASSASLPFINRVHYSWEYAVHIPEAPLGRGVRITSLYGAATYLSLFGVVIPLDTGQTSWHPGPTPDTQAILAEAEDDAQIGRYSDALAKHVWFHENALKLAPAMAGVRLSYALSSWKSLGDSYPPALEKLRAERDKAADNVRSEKDARHSFHDFRNINRVLGEDEKTGELFHWLDSNKPKVATEVFDIAQPVLVKAKEYQICGKYLDPDRSFQRMLRIYEEHKKFSVRTDETRDFEAKWFTNSVGTLIALLVVNQRQDEANRIADEARKTWDDPGFREQLDRALKGEVPPPWP